MAPDNPGHPEHDAKVGDMNVESADGPVSTEDIAQETGTCPVAHATYPVEGGSNNQGWWPNRLNLKILAKHTAGVEPDGRRLRLPRGVRQPRPRRGQERHRGAC